MKPIHNPVLQVNIIHEADGTYTCDQSYAAIMNTVKAGGHVFGYYVDKATGTGRTGAGVHQILGVAMQTLNSKIGFRYYAILFNASTGAATGSISVVYMAPDGTISTTA